MILKIAKKYHFGHLGSNLTAYPIIKDIFKKKKPDEKFVLSCGHAGLALAVVMHPKSHIDYDLGGSFERNIAAEKIEKNIHADRSWCDCSTGSLGHGLGIAVGMALADKSKNVYCLISDGECAEGSIWEALRIAGEKKLTNLKVYCNANGWSAYGPVDLDALEKRLKAFFSVIFVKSKQAKPYTGQEAHYARF
jgi:transketolase